MNDKELRRKRFFINKALKRRKMRQDARINRYKEIEPGVYLKTY